MFSRTGIPTIVADGKQGDLKITHPGRNTDVLTFEAENAFLSLGCKERDGDISLKNSKGETSIDLNGEGVITFSPGNGKVPVITLMNQNNTGSLALGGNATIYLNAGGGRFVIEDAAGRRGFDLYGADGKLYVGSNGKAGNIFIRSSSGKEVIHIDGNAGDIKLQGADCAEDFEISDRDSVESGVVLVIDDDGKLRPCDRPYDKRVAGVVSGARGLRPGLILGRDPSNDREKIPVALAGKVYCKVDARYSPIATGDLLTTSPTSGHAMKASDPMQAFGAVVGKALRPLESGMSLLPILASLQ